MTTQIVITNMTEEFLTNPCPSPSLYPCHLRQWCDNATKIATDMTDSDASSRTSQVSIDVETMPQQGTMRAVIGSSFVGFVHDDDLWTTGFEMRKAHTVSSSNSKYNKGIKRSVTAPVAGKTQARRRAAGMRKQGSFTSLTSQSSHASYTTYNTARSTNAKFENGLL